MYPADSLVVALLERCPPADEVCIKVVARQDLHISDSRLAAVMTRLADVATDKNAATVLVLIIDGSAQPASALPVPRPERSMRSPPRAAGLSVAGHR
ncbi:MULTISPECIES: DUF4192 family protein [Nocardia]|uniref:DUF4192 family protein n=1 Tax=Nocardia violaceofusca TaxID=941182 RepID=UPI00352C8DC8